MNRVPPVIGAQFRRFRLIRLWAGILIGDLAAAGLFFAVQRWVAYMNVPMGALLAVPNILLVPAFGGLVTSWIWRKLNLTILGNLIHSAWDDPGLDTAPCGTDRAGHKSGPDSESQGEDPYCGCGPVSFPAEKTLWMEIEVRSEAGGLAHLFFTPPGSGFSEEHSVRFPIPKQIWSTLKVPLPPL